MAAEQIVGSTGIGAWWVVLMGLLGAAMGAFTLLFSPKHRQELWYDDRNDRRERERAKALFGDKDKA